MRHTGSLAAVAIVLMTDTDDRHWGYELSKKSDLRSGVLYPILARMLSAGWLTDGWEDPVTVASGRPPRRYYQLTDRGRIELGAVVSEARKRAPVRTAIRAIRIAT
jgi:PadR family transcriptional regulator, regulatory protein PadR